MYHAAIDIGTNSVRLLVVINKDGVLQPTYRDLCTTRLGSGLVETGLLPEQGKQLTLTAVTQFFNQARKLRATSIVIFATSALREAKDGPLFAMQIATTIGHPVEIINEETEARYSYIGVSKSLSAHGDPLVFDLGGGSCELIWSAGQALSYLSLKVGAVYLTDAFFHHDPPTAREVEATRRHVRNRLLAYPFPKKPLVGVGGTVTSLAANALQMTTYDPDRVHGFSLRRDGIRAQLESMLTLNIAARSQLPGIRKNRAMILPAGTIVIDVLLEICHADFLTVSEGDILLGSLYTTNAKA